MNGSHDCAAFVASASGLGAAWLTAPRKREATTRAITVRVTGRRYHGRGCARTAHRRQFGRMAGIRGAAIGSLVALALAATACGGGSAASGDAGAGGAGAGGGAPR